MAPKLHEKYIRVLFIASLLYVATYFYVFFINVSKSETMKGVRWVVAAAPFYVLVALGSYLLFRLGLDVFTFNNYPEERAKLEQVSMPLSLLACPSPLPCHQDIAEAKKDLARRGFKSN